MPCGFFNASECNTKRLEKILTNINKKKSLLSKPQLNLKVGFDTKMTLVHPPPTYNLPTRNSMSAISQMLLIKFWPNLTIYNCQNDMCPCNICFGYLCPTSLHTKVIYSILTKIDGWFSCLLFNHIHGRGGEIYFI